VVVLMFGGCFSAGGNAGDTPLPPTDDTPSNPTQLGGNPPPEDVTWISPGKVMVANYYPGGTAEYPLSIHNGLYVIDPKTGVKSPKAGNAIFQIECCYSINVDEGYSLPLPEVQDWVIVADATPILEPGETKNINISLVLPSDTEEWAIPVYNLSDKGSSIKTKLESEYNENAQEASQNNQPLPAKEPLLVFLEDIYGQEVGSVVIPLEYKDYVVQTDEGKWEFWVRVMDISQTSTVKTAMATKWLISMRSG